MQRPAARKTAAPAAPRQWALRKAFILVAAFVQESSIDP
jgi:hypothetical protein